MGGIASRMIRLGLCLKIFDLRFDPIPRCRGLNNTRLNSIFLCSGQSLVRVRAQVMTRDDSSGGWVSD